MNYYEQRFSNASTPTAEDEGFTLSEIFPKRIRKPTRPLIEQVPWPDARVEVSKAVSLIKSIPQEMHPRVERMMIRLFRGQSTREGLMNWLVEKCGVSEARARLIADDQTVKISEALLRIKWSRRGVKYVRWVHGESSEPRDYHRQDWDGRSASAPNALNGLVFPINQPPVIDVRTGERGYPGQLVGCTCHLEPVVPPRRRRSSK